MADVDRPGRPALYTAPFLALCAIAFLGFAQSFTLQPIVPLLVLHLGGDTVAVGIALGVFSIPSIVLRPFIGRFADRWGQETTMLLGTTGKAICAALYLIPSLPTLIGIRAAHGVAWAGFTTGSTSTLARIAPPMRRLEASGLFDLMPSLAALLMPAAALLLLDSVGFTGPLILAASLGAGATLVNLVAFRPRLRRRDAQRPPSARGAWLEPAAVLPMVMVLLFTSAASLFLVYPPLLAADRGIPLTDLAFYYPIYGLVLAGSRGASGRLFEHTPRSPLLAACAVIAGVGLVIGAFATSLVTLTLAAGVFAVAYGIAPPTAQAVVMERAPRERLGAAMATYTLGFQMGSGLGAAIWGFLLAPLGFTNVFIVAAGIQLLLVVVALARRLDPKAEPASG
jgi:MFS family permease